MRVTVAMILGQLAGGQTVEEVLAVYPYLERDDVLAALQYTAAMVDERELPVAHPCEAAVAGSGRRGGSTRS